MITRIILWDDLDFTPASCIPALGIINLSYRHIRQMPVEYVLFIILHEWAHCTYATDIEEEADYYAFQEYAKRGYSLKAVIQAITSVLDLELYQGHRERAARLLARAIEYQNKK